MNPIRIIRNAYATLSTRVSEKADRLVSEDRARLERRARYADAIARSRALRKQPLGGA